MSESRARKLTRDVEAFLGHIILERCLDCPFCLGADGGPYTCGLTVEPKGDNGVQWKHVHGNAAPPSWCPIRKHDEVKLTIQVPPSPDHWHKG